MDLLEPGGWGVLEYRVGQLRPPLIQEKEQLSAELRIILPGRYDTYFQLINDLLDPARVAQTRGQPHCGQGHGAGCLPVRGAVCGDHGSWSLRRGWQGAQLLLTAFPLQVQEDDLQGVLAVADLGASPLLVVGSRHVQPADQGLTTLLGFTQKKRLSALLVVSVFY